MQITKYHLIFCCTLLLGCNSDIQNSQNNEDTIVHFYSYILTLPSTKSIIASGSFPDASQIGIYSWGHHQKDGNVNTILREDLNNAKYIKETGNESLVTSTHAHYPINADTLLNFYAYYPYIASSTANPQSLIFDLSKQEDIMWATPILNRGKVSAESSVNLQFNHILSAITLKFKKADDIKEEMILQSISMENYSPVVQLDVQTGKLTQSVSTTPFTIASGKNIAITPQEVTIVTDFLLCPVTEPSFIVRLSNKDYVIKSKKAFEGGKKQTYEFTIQASDISITGQINPWIDGGSSDETVYF